MVVMTSEAGFEGKRLLAAYAMVKAQQRSLVSVLAREWGPSGVRLNAVAPLATASPAMERAFVADPAMEQRVMATIPLGRLGDAADDIGVAVRFLLGDDRALRDRPDPHGRRRQLPRSLSLTPGQAGATGPSPDSNVRRRGTTSVPTC